MTDFGPIIGLDLAAVACRVVADQLDAGEVTPAAALDLARWGIRTAGGPAEIDGELYAGMRDMARGDSYVAMLPMLVTDGAGAHTNALFDRVSQGVGSDFTIPTANDGTVHTLNGEATFAAAYSTSHDTVAVVSLPARDFAAVSTPGATTLQDRTDGIDKIYVNRHAPASDLEAVAAGTSLAWSNGYRVTRVPAAAARFALYPQGHLR